MKAVLIIFISTLLIGVQLLAQCPEGDVELKNQAKVDDFVTNYPNCTEINGDLTISYVWDGTKSDQTVNDLSGLSSLTSIKGNLLIILDWNFTDLSGLENLKKIEGYLHVIINEYHIKENDRITFDLTALKELAEVGEDFKLGGRWADRVENKIVEIESSFENLISIGGNFQFPEKYNTQTNFDALQSIGGQFYISNLSSLSIFHALSYIDELSIRKNRVLTNLTGLENVDTIGRLLIEENESLVNLDGLNNLQVIKNEFEIKNNRKLENINSLKRLKKLPYNFTIEENNLLENLVGLDSLSFIYGNFEIINNSSLTSLSGLESLDSINGNFKIINNNALTDLSGLESLKSVVKDSRWTVPWKEFTIESNNNLTNLNALNSLTQVDLLFISDNPSLINLKGLDNLKKAEKIAVIRNPALNSLSGLENITSIGDFEVSVNDALTNLSPLNLNSVSRDLVIFENNALTDLSALSSISFIGDRLSITSNPLLSDLSGLDNVISIGKIWIFDNPMLGNCSVKSICNHLIGSSAWIDNNAEGCVNRNAILDNCSFALIKSQIFYDANQNKLKDEDEPLLTVGGININPGSINLRPNEQGGFDNYSLSPGTYTFSVDDEILQNWSITTDTTYTYNLEDGALETVSFGIYPKAFVSEMHTYIQSPNTRCNESILFTLTAKNLGTTYTNGILWLEKDSSIIVETFVDEPDTLIPPNRYGWFYNNLTPSHTVSKVIRFTIPGPPDFEIGNALFFKSYTSFKDENGEHQTNTRAYEPVVRCSYDPNDKLVQPQRQCGYTLLDENLTYTIRFQNTGNDVARRVAIADELDINLDLSTFNLIGSSHSEYLTTSFTDGGWVRFEFNDINLPDSTANLEGSQGYVSYTVKPNAGLTENTIIENSSYIFFDYNPAIKTNIVENRLVSEIPTIVCNCGENVIPTWCRDEDLDGLGDPDQTMKACDQPEGYVRDCTDPSDVVGLLEVQFSNIFIYPNPSQGSFAIDIGNSNHFKKAHFRLYSANGNQLTESISLDKTQQQYQLPNLTNGLYYVNLVIDKKYTQKKLLIIQ